MSTKVINVKDTSIPGLPGVQIFFDNGYVLSVIEPLYAIGSAMKEMAVWKEPDGNFIRGSKWNDDVYRFFTAEELYAECMEIIPGFLNMIPVRKAMHHIGI